MALKALMLRKKIDLKKKELDKVRASMKDMEKREAELEAAVEEVSTEEEQATVQESVDTLIEEKEKLEESAAELDKVIKELEGELADEEAKQDTETQTEVVVEERSTPKMNKIVTRAAGGYSMRERLAGIVTRQEVKSYLTGVRESMAQKRALTNVGLTIPEVLLGLLRENVEEYSKLYKHVTVRSIRGTGRQLIMGAVPEAIWTDCCANLNELSLVFNDLEMDCYKVGGFFAVCNANLEDSDIDLASEILTAAGQALGLALDKAILYGRNAVTTMKMPQGIVSRLVQTEQPTGYPATARTWADLHTTNIITIPSGTTGAALISAIVTASGAAKGKYSRGGKVWAMNELTYTALMAATVATDANGRIVTGVADVMPVVGGDIEVLDFIPDNVIIGGYFDLYILAERAGQQFASSEHVRFVQDQTVFKATARYDGAPAIAESFVAIGINGATPTAAMTFATDTAN